MKKIKIFLILIALLANIYAQIPNGFSYQAVVRGADNVLVKNKTIKIKSSILKSGETIFTQTQTATTNENGLLSIVIGNDDFQTIDWTDGPLFIKTQIDLEGGDNYTIEMETQLLTVPYAMAAKTAVNVPGLDALIERVNKLEEEVEELKDLLGINPCNCIMDTLKGEWIWTKEYGGIGGNTWDNEFKSVIRILSQNEDASINYQVFVEDTLFYEGIFQIQIDQWNRKTANIKLPHILWYNDYWEVYHYNILAESVFDEETGLFYKPLSKEDLTFWDRCDDGYYYIYKKIK